MGMEIDDSFEDEPSRSCSSRPRSIETFYDDAHNNNTFTSHGNPIRRRWRYYMIIFAVAFGSVADELEYGTMAYVVSDRRFQNKMLHHDLELGSGLFISVSIGSMVGRMLSGRFMDHPSPRLGGRKKIFLVGLVTNILADVATAASPTLNFMLICQVFAGFGAALTYSGASVLLLEIFPRSHRGRYSSITGLFWGIGGLYASAVAVAFLQNDTDIENGAEPINGGYEGVLGTTDISSIAGWRLYSLAVAIPSVVALFLVLGMVPESPRYLALSDRFEEALEAANYVGDAMTGRQSGWQQIAETCDEDVSVPGQVPKLRIDELRFFYGKSKEISNDDPIRTKTTPSSFFTGYFSFFENSSLRKRIMALLAYRVLSVLPGSMSAQWKMTMLRSLSSEWIKANAYALGSVLTLTGLVTHVGTLFFIDKISRRSLSTIGYITSSIIMLIYSQTIKRQLPEDGCMGEGDDDVTSNTNEVHVVPVATLVACLCLAAIAGTLVGSVASLWTNELLPTDLRGTGASVIGFFAGGSWIVTQSISGILMEKCQPTTVLLLSSLGMLSAGLVPILFTPSIMPDTNCMDLIDSSEDNDLGQGRMQILREEPFDETNLFPLPEQEIELS